MSQQPLHPAERTSSTAWRQRRYRAVADLAIDPLDELRRLRERVRLLESPVFDR